MLGGDLLDPRTRNTLLLIPRSGSACNLDMKPRTESAYLFDKESKYLKVSSDIQPLFSINDLKRELVLGTLIIHIHKLSDEKTP